MTNEWHIVSGTWKIDGSKFTHIENVNNVFPDSLLINKNQLIDGKIEAEIVFNSLRNKLSTEPHSASIVFRYQSPHNYYFAGVGGYKKKFVIGKRIPQGSYAINTFGLGKEIEEQHPYKLLLNISGRKFSLFLNGENGKIKILDAVDTIEPFYDNGNTGIKVFDNEDVDIKNFGFTNENPKCFVIMPFKDKILHKLKIKDIIFEAANHNGLNPFLANEIFDIKPIINDIIESIDTSLIIIAEITKDNANVFYETGIAHAKNSNVILICDEKRRRGKLPFDIAHLRCIFYKSMQVEGDNGEELQKNLEKTMKSVLERTSRFTQQESLNFLPG